MRLRRPNATLIRKLRAHMKRGGVVSYATESCYGLGCAPLNFRAVRRLLRLKQRPQSKGLILVGGSLGQVQPYLAPLTPAQRQALMQSWPGPVSFLLPASRKAARWLIGRHQKIAVRVTAHPEASALCDALGMALVSTSANCSGLKAIKTYRNCARAFSESAFNVPGKIGKRKTPSSIIDFATGQIVRR